VFTNAPTLADASDPLGKLQRGLGSGYLWAVDADRTIAHALLVHCVFNDPRWDRQLDDRADYHATLALDVGLDLAPLEGWLEASGDEDSETAHEILGVLGRMAIRGHAEAERVLREYVAYGAVWARAIEGLVGEDAPARRGAPWPEAVAGLDAVLLERFATQDALDEALAGVDPRERPWTLWSVENPAIAKALALEQGHVAPVSRAWRPRERQVKAADMYTVELLAITESSRWAQIAEELAKRTDPYDVDLLVQAANAPDLPMRRAAIVALGHQGRREVLAIAEANTHQAERGKLQGAIALALEAMPLSQTRALAHDWLTEDDWARRRKAAGMLAAWAVPSTASSTAASTPTSTSSARSPRRSGAAPCTARSRNSRARMSRSRIRMGGARSSPPWRPATRRSPAISRSSACGTASARRARSRLCGSTAACGWRRSAWPSCMTTRRRRRRCGARRRRGERRIAPRRSRLRRASA